MQKISTFFNSLVKSLTSPSYYSDVLKAKMSFSLKYFLFLTILLSLISAVKIAIPVALFDLAGAASKVVSVYPSDLVITAKNGRVSINQPLPYIVPMPQEIKQNSPNNLFVFDSDKNVESPADFYKYDTSVLVTETSIYTVQESGGTNTIKIYQIPNEANATLSSAQINTWKNQFLNLPLIKSKMYVVLIGLIIFLLWVPLTYLFRVVTAFLFAIISYFIFTFLKKQLLHDTQLTYSKVAQVSLHTLTLPILLSYLTSFVMPISPIHGWLYFGIYFVFTAFVLNQATAQMSPTPVSSAKVTEPEVTPVTKKTSKSKSA